MNCPRSRVPRQKVFKPGPTRTPGVLLPGKREQPIESFGETCISCGACVGICPLNCIYLDEWRIGFDEGVCTRCGICVRACPVGAITIG